MPAPHLKRRLIAFVAALAMLIATPLAVVASDVFTDVPSTNIFHDDITWLANAGVTKGCNPPANTLFCPSDNVTRQQMAAFMRRLAENKVVDAATAVEANHALSADNATTAGDADTLDGKNSTAFVEEGEANSVTSAMLTNEPGVALATTDGQILLDGTLSPIVSVSLDAPTSGYVVVNADMQLNLNHSMGTLSQAVLGFSTSSSAFTQNHQDNAVGVPSGAASGYYFLSPGLTDVIPVSTGTVTVYLLGREDAGNVGVNDATVSAVFVPTSYGGVPTAGESSGGDDPAN